MNLTFFSDTHNKHMMVSQEHFKGGDIIMCCGDITSRGGESEVRAFLNWYTTLPYTHKIFIAGNHDFLFEDSSTHMIDFILSDYPNITYLNDSGVDIEGIKIWGSPVQPTFHNWAFNRDEDEIGKHWDLIPDDTNILLVHGPVNGILDMTSRGESTGCPQLLNKVNNLKELKIFSSGHIHESYGRYETDGKLFLNASLLNLRYELQNRPITLEYGNNNTLDLGYILK